MNEEMIALGRRAVACNGWRWMPGMLAASPSSPYEMHRVISSGLGCTHLTTGLYQAGGIVEQSGPTASALLPMLDDPATLGCLLALVREAWDIPLHLDDTGERMMTIQSGPGGSTLVIDRIDGDKDRKLFNGWRDVSVFVAALEAAP